MNQREQSAIDLARRTTTPHTWYPSFDLAVERTADGLIRLICRDRNRAVYAAMCAYARNLVNQGRARNFREGRGELNWTVSFEPVQPQ